ncbi:VQ motif-containing protein 9-like [Typha angustifolia]|uniref:VQ motif-containing protein 9-like n=1 Tax=Typha angustifolia TaxID=59011 RepID=UPI003C30029D
MEKTNHSFATNPSNVTTTTASSTNPTTSSSSITTAANSGSTIQSSLKSLNKSSYKISKTASGNRYPNSNPTHPAQPPPQAAITSGDGGGAPPQPPVYNIDKDDFREVVQKLTGSPANHQIRPAAPPPSPPAAAAAPTSRLHRIRPPPLVHLAQRPPPPLVAGESWTRPPFSPLPPLPAVNTAAESPISAYMRRLHGEAQSPSAAAGIQPPTSPIGYGCLSSPRTAYDMMMSAGMGLPTSPGVPMPTASPR